MNDFHIHLKKGKNTGNQILEKKEENNNKMEESKNINVKMRNQ